mgnify:CR=1 FL=1
MEYVIIGNGVAGIHAAEAIRRQDPAGPITLVGDETFLPYCRPMISMVLEGAVPMERLPIRGADYYEKLGITPVLGRRVTSIDVDARRVHLPGHPAGIPFDRLLIASGADPRPIKADGLDLEGIFYMRTEAQVRAMLETLPSVKNALVLGGGLVGFKAAYGLVRRGVRVTQLIRSDYPLSMQVDRTAGEMILAELVRKGLDVRVGVAATGFFGRGRVEGARLSDGSELGCDMVVIGKGVLPALSFVPRDRIDIDLGILVDAHMETCVPGIYAAGDAAEFFDIARKTRWVNAIWPEAVIQGRTAGMNMAGRPVALQGSLSRNVIRIFDMDIMTGGWVDPPDSEGFQVVRRIDRRSGAYRKLVLDGDRLVGAVMVNHIEQGGLLIALIQRQAPLRMSGEKLISTGFNYRQLLN